MKHYFFYIFIFILIGIFFFSQNIDISDFSSVNFLELNSSELDLLLRRASSQGYNQFDLIKMAKAQGLSEKDIEKLNSKFENSEAIKRVSSNASSPIENTRLREDYNQSISIVRAFESGFSYDTERNCTNSSDRNHTRKNDTTNRVIEI